MLCGSLGLSDVLIHASMGSGYSLFCGAIVYVLVRWVHPVLFVI